MGEGGAERPRTTHRAVIWEDKGEKKRVASARAEGVRLGIHRGSGYVDVRDRGGGQRGVVFFNEPRVYVRRPFALALYAFLHSLAKYWILNSLASFPRRLALSWVEHPKIKLP